MAILAGDVASFNQSAYIESLIALIDVPTASVSLTVEATSIRVTAILTIVDAEDANRALEILVAFATAPTDALGVTVLSALAPILAAPPSNPPPAPTTPPLDNGRSSAMTAEDDTSSTASRKAFRRSDQSHHHRWIDPNCYLSYRPHCHLLLLLHTSK